MLDIAIAGSIFADLSATKSHLFNIIPEKIVHFSLSKSSPLPYSFILAKKFM